MAALAGLLAATGGAAAWGAAAVAANPATSLSRTPRGSSSRGLDVLPFPATPDAPPATNIDFPAISPGQIASVTATGSRSGPHEGRLSARPAGHGTAFTPARPFIPGETVTITATLRTAAAGTASGAPGRRHLAYSFEIARPAALAQSSQPTGPLASSLGLAASSNRPAGSPPLTHTFVTEPAFTPPVVTMSGHDSDPSSGGIFLDAQNTGQNAAYIMNSAGDLLWYKPTSGSGKGPAAFNLRVQSYQNQPVLTYWQGNVVFPPGGGQGAGKILNEHYQVIHTVTAGAGYQNQGTDMHDFTLGHEGSEGVAFVQIWSPVQYNLTSVGGPPNGTVCDWIIQEIDIATNKVIWQWHALGHVPITASYQRYTPGQPYDYFHLNSIQPLSDGHIIISARHTSAVYSINKATGKIDWELGGKHSSFNMGAGTRFYGQHDATLHANGLLTVFDDGVPPPEEKQSRALEIHISTNKHQATLVHAYTHTPSTLANSMGNTELLPNHNVFVGWGSRPYFSEYAQGGTQMFGGSFRSPVESYRAYRFGNWVGSPLQSPAVALRRSSTSGKDNLYASWNGATRVAKWRVQGSASAQGRFTNVGSPVPWSSFESTVSISTATDHYFRVQALDGAGNVLANGTSAVAHAP